MKRRQAGIEKKLEHPPGIVVLSEAGVAELADQIKEDIAHRAYEIFERRGSAHAHDLADWFQAESEIVRDLPSDSQESARQILLRIDLTGLDTTTLRVGVESRHVILRGRTLHSHDGANGALGHDGNVGGTVCFVDLPAEVDAPRAKAVIEGPFLEVIAEKLRT